MPGASTSIHMHSVLLFRLLALFSPPPSATSHPHPHRTSRPLPSPSPAPMSAATRAAATEAAHRPRTLPSNHRRSARHDSSSPPSLPPSSSRTPTISVSSPSPTSSSSSWARRAIILTADLAHAHRQTFALRAHVRALRRRCVRRYGRGRSHARRARRAMWQRLAERVAMSYALVTAQTRLRNLDGQFAEARDTYVEAAMRYNQAEEEVRTRAEESVGLQRRVMELEERVAQVEKERDEAVERMRVMEGRRRRRMSSSSVSSTGGAELTEDGPGTPVGSESGEMLEERVRVLTQLSERRSVEGAVLKEKMATLHSRMREMVDCGLPSGVEDLVVRDTESETSESDLLGKGIGSRRREESDEGKVVRAASFKVLVQRRRSRNSISGPSRTVSSSVTTTGR